jgi:hypothetical protein
VILFYLTPFGLRKGVAMRKFWLIQRLKKNPVHKGEVTLPEHLELDYMGASEFEFGKVPMALISMQKQPLEFECFDVTIGGVTKKVYAIAVAEKVASLQAEFQDWIDSGARSMEETYLTEIFSGKDWRGEPLKEESYHTTYPLAWWDIGCNVFWSLDERITSAWLEAIRNNGKLCAVAPLVML